MQEKWGSYEQCNQCPAGTVPSNASRVECVSTPLNYYRDLSGEMAVCESGFYCAGGANPPDACIPAAACLGATCNFEGGYADCRPGFVRCGKTFYQISDWTCYKCTNNVWLVFPLGLAALSFLFFGILSFGKYLRPWVDAFSLTLRKNKLSVLLLGDQVTRLLLLKRLPTIALPSDFAAALGWFAVFLGLNTASSGLACSGVPWSFEQSFGVTIGGTASLCLFGLGLDEHNRRRGLTIPFAQWHVWDILDTVLPISNQAAWQALSYVNINGRNILLADRITEFDAPHFKPIIIFSIIIIILDFGFMIVRNWLPCVPCRASFVERADPRKSGRFLAVKRRESDGLKVLTQVANEELSTFNGLRALLIRVRTLSIPICTYYPDNNFVPSVFLLAVNGAEFLLLLGVPNSRKLIVESHGVFVTLTLFFVFAATHGVGVFCASVGGCPGPTFSYAGSSGIGALLIVANAFLFLTILRPIYVELKKRAAVLRTQLLETVYEENESEAFVQGVVSDKPDAKYVLLSFGKPVVSSTPPRAKPAATPRAEAAAAAVSRHAAAPSWLTSMASAFASRVFPSTSPRQRSLLPGSVTMRMPVADASGRLTRAASVRLNPLNAPPAEPKVEYPDTCDTFGHPLAHGWTRASDPANGDVWYTHASEPPRWVAPLLEEVVAPLNLDDGQGRPLADGWTRVVDPADGAVYFVHETGASQWDPPLRVGIDSVSADDAPISPSPASQEGVKRNAVASLTDAPADPEPLRRKKTIVLADAPADVATDVARRKPVSLADAPADARAFVRKVTSLADAPDADVAVRRVASLADAPDAVVALRRVTSLADATDDE